MRILLLGEASFVHSTLRQGLRELGHEVVLMSDGNKRNNCPRDIDLRRDMKWGKLGGIMLLLKLLRHLPKLIGNDIVQIQNFQFVPLRVWWNKLLLIILKLGNKKVVKCCLTDDIVVMRRQAEGVLRYSDTHIGTQAINKEENKERIAEQMRPDYIHCCDYANSKADALLPCLYEYYAYYALPEYRHKLYYMPLPMSIPDTLSACECDVKSPVKVLVGIQKERDYMKGASVISALVERLAEENQGRIEIKKVYDVPYNEYMAMLDEADVLVDQLYSYTPSMNSLVAMAHDTVVIGGGEEEYYDFIGEKTLRPIINVRPADEEYNMKALRGTLLNPERITHLKRQGMEFIRKHHDYVKVSRMYVDVYTRLLGR